MPDLLNIDSRTMYRLRPKEETEEVMERLMGKIVTKPNLIADDSLNAKIEKIFNVDAF